MPKMPVLFVGHGSPMNAIEDNEYSKNWKRIAKEIPVPKAIISVSAHWCTRGTRILDEESPKTIHDMYGFPTELYEIIYDAPGSPKFAGLAKNLISHDSEFDKSWGIDHGTWSVLVHMYPERDIPLFQISIDMQAEPKTHYKIGNELRGLREQGVLIFGSGNVVHNLRLVNWNMRGEGFAWAYEFDEHIRNSIINKNYDKVIDYLSFGEIAKLAVPNPDHYFPLLYALGASDEDDTVSVYNNKCELGSLSMTAYLWKS